MVHHPVQELSFLTRRRLLRGAVSGATGLLAWHQAGPWRQTAMAQKGVPTGQMVWAVHVTITPTWFDPAAPLKVPCNKRRRVRDVTPGEELHVMPYLLRVNPLPWASAGKLELR
jgi:hypothetical protein